MAHGLESRVPLLDHALVEFAATHAGQREVQGRRAEAHRSSAPRATCCRARILERKDKMGFPVPLGEWMHGDLRDFVARHAGGPERASAAVSRPSVRPRGADLRARASSAATCGRSCRSSSGSRSSTTVRPSGGSTRRNLQRRQPRQREPVRQAASLDNARRAVLEPPYRQLDSLRRRGELGGLSRVALREVPALPRALRPLGRPRGREDLGLRLRSGQRRDRASCSTRGLRSSSASMYRRGRSIWRSTGLRLHGSTPRATGS